MKAHLSEPAQVWAFPAGRCYGGPWCLEVNKCFCYSDNALKKISPLTALEAHEDGKVTGLHLAASPLLVAVVEVRLSLVVGAGIIAVVHLAELGATAGVEALKQVAG